MSTTQTNPKPNFSLLPGSRQGAICSKWRAPARTRDLAPQAEPQTPLLKHTVQSSRGVQGVADPRNSSAVIPQAGHVQRGRAPVGTCPICGTRDRSRTATPKALNQNPTPSNPSPALPVNHRTPLSPAPILLTLSFFLLPFSSFAAINASQTLILQTGGIERVRITSAGISASTYFGDGSNLTNVSGAGIPTKTTTQRNAMSPTAGTIIYNSTNNRLEWYNGAGWFTQGQVGSATTNTTSCKTILDTNGSTGNGIYTLTGGLNVYCDMTTSGGGWTLVAAQFEADVAPSWNEGTQADYDPSLATGKAFTLSSAQLPTHTQTAFGKDLNPTFIEYFDYTYTTGNLSLATLTGKKTGYNFQIYRNTSSFYSACDPEQTLGNEAQWNNNLEIDRTGGTYYNWCYAPNASTSQGRGSYMDGGSNIYTTSESYAWTVWVR